MKNWILKWEKFYIYDTFYDADNLYYFIIIMGPGLSEVLYPELLSLLFDGSFTTLVH